MAALAAGCGESRQPAGQVRLVRSSDSPVNERLVGPTLEEAVRTVNREIRLPSNVSVRLVGDDEAQRRGITGPTYEPGDRAVYFPWSFVDESRRQLGDDRALRAATVFVLYHELTHGIIDLVDVPVVGGEERAADSLAAVFAIRSQSGGQAIPLGMTKLFEGRQGGEAPGAVAQDYADDHELDGQRAADALCLVYGSDPGRYARLVGRDLPKTRADTCRFEYEQEVRAWRRLLKTWLTKRGGLRPE